MAPNTTQQKEITLDLDDEALARDLARKLIYSFVSAAISDPHYDRSEALFQEQFREDVRRACEYLASEVPDDVDIGPGEKDPRKLNPEPLLEELEKGRDELQQLHLDIFGHTISKECPPYELEYLERTDLFYRSRELADIAGFYRAFGLEKNKEHHHRADHLTLQSEFMSFLISKRLYGKQHDHDQENLEVCRDAEESFFEDHLHWWLPSFANALEDEAKDTFYGRFGTFLSRFSVMERIHFDVEPEDEVVEPTVMEYDPEDDACGDCDIPASKMAVNRNQNQP